MARKKRNTPGNVVKIGLGDGLFSYGRVLENPLVAFYDKCTARELTPSEIVCLPNAFILCVMNCAINSGRWTVVSYSDLGKDLQEPVPFFKKDAINGKLSIYVDGSERAATEEQCRGLERAAIWDPEHVEDRLRDHFSGLPNKWVTSLSLDQDS